MPSGVAFGIGLLMTGFVALNLWPIVLGMLATVISLAKYALAKPNVVEVEEGPVYPSGGPVE